MSGLWRPETLHWSVSKTCLIDLVKKEETIRAVLTALHYPTGPPKEAKASSLVAREDDLSGSGRGTDESTDWPEYPD